MFRVLITGATGKMGLETVKAVLADQEMELVGALGNANFIGEDIGSLAGIKEIGIKIKHHTIFYQGSKKIKKFNTLG